MILLLYIYIYIYNREADILQSDWSSADIIYISSICFSDNFMQTLFEKCKLLKMGSKLLTLKLPIGYEEWYIYIIDIYFVYNIYIYTCNFILNISLIFL